MSSQKVLSSLPTILEVAKRCGVAYVSYVLEDMPLLGALGGQRSRTVVCSRRGGEYGILVRAKLLRRAVRSNARSGDWW